MAYYITETRYAGPNQDQHRDADHYLIQTVPAIANSSREVRTEGWCGTTNDWALYAHGEFETLDAARAKIAELLPDGYRSMEPSDYATLGEEDGGVGAIEMFKQGIFEPADRGMSQTFVYDDVRERVTANTTDAEIAEMVEEWQHACREHWQQELDEDAAREAAEERRDEMKAEAAEGAE